MDMSRRAQLISCSCNTLLRYRSCQHRATAMCVLVFESDTVQPFYICHGWNEIFVSKLSIDIVRKIGDLVQINMEAHGV